LRAAARADAEQRLDLSDYIERYRNLIENIAGKELITFDKSKRKATAF
jgi:hypothetical protein